LSYCMYLRKSRADLEAEARGEGETLKRHEKNIARACTENDIFISEMQFTGRSSLLKHCFTASLCSNCFQK
jgi:hypothetical protein